MGLRVSPMPIADSFRVLIVEDDEATRANLQDILELDAYPVESAGTVAEVLKRSDWSRLSAIILDRRLPDGSAEQLLPRLRELAPGAAVIIVTGHADIDGAIAAIRQGAVDYILKPIDADQLRNRLASLAERKRLAAELKEAQQRALQAERLAAIGQVYAGLTHESRNALQRSQACLERLAKRVRDQPEALDLIDRVQDAQNHLHQLYEEVRNYAAPLNHLDRQRRDLGELLRQTWENLGPARDGRITRLVENDDRPDLGCAVDAYRIEQIFRNTLENSLSACTDPVEIRVNWNELDLNGSPNLQVRIRDNGPGLTAEARQRIFEPFYTTKTRGTGLGMAITKRIVEAHGGYIAVSDHSGPGAEIEIVLPRGNP
jgi:two-component system, NtrC family, sensor histidine kinase HydH